jgi:hypothetical protein
MRDDMLERPSQGTVNAKQAQFLDRSCVTPKYRVQKYQQNDDKSNHQKIEHNAS